MTSLFSHPTNSPWGEIDCCDDLYPGVFMVTTSSHGGIMVARDVESLLSPAARKLGLRRGGYLCYEEDCDEAVVLRELLDKSLWDIPERVQDKTKFESSIDETLQLYHPEYWRSRERGLQNSHCKSYAAAER